MPYQPLVNKLNLNCQSFLDGKKLFEQVNAAMQSPPEERDNALKNVIKKSFLEDAGAYQDLRTKYSIHYRVLSVEMSMQDIQNKERMYNIPKYFSEYLGIIEEMVKDIDPNHKVKPFFGLNEKETVDMQLKVADTVTRKEAISYELFNVRKDFDHFYEDIALATADPKTKNRYIYSTADPAVKNGIESVYMTKKIIEEELKSRGWIWRIRNWSGEAKKMRDAIKAADKALKDVQFPRDRKTKNTIKASYEKADIYGAEKDTIRDVACKRYSAAAEEKDSVSKLFHVRFRPPTDLAALNEQLKVVGKLTEQLNHNDAISSAAKKVFNANQEKMIFMKHYIDEYQNPNRDKEKYNEERVEEEFKKMQKQFDKMDENLLVNYPNYVSITLDDVNKAINMRESVAQTVVQDLDGHVTEQQMSQPIEKTTIGKVDSLTF